jgi:hypothetical protein
MRCAEWTARRVSDASRPSFHWSIFDEEYRPILMKIRRMTITVVISSSVNAAGLRMGRSLIFMTGVL